MTATVIAAVLGIVEGAILRDWWIARRDSKYSILDKIERKKLEKDD